MGWPGIQPGLRQSGARLSHRLVTPEPAILLIRHPSVESRFSHASILIVADIQRSSSQLVRIEARGSLCSHISCHDIGRAIALQIEQGGEVAMCDDGTTGIGKRGITHLRFGAERDAQ